MYYGILFYIIGFIYSVCVFGAISHCIVVNIDIFNFKFSDNLLFHLSLTALLLWVIHKSKYVPEIIIIN